MGMYKLLLLAIFDSCDGISDREIHEEKVPQHRLELTEMTQVSLRAEVPVRCPEEVP